MKNWSTDTKKLSKNQNKFTIWKLEQLINFGLGNEKITYPKGIEAQIYDWELLLKITEKIVISIEISTGGYPFFSYSRRFARC